MIEIQKPRIDCVETPGDESYGKYVVEPLERGYGITLGNALRRILLSSLLFYLKHYLDCDSLYYIFRYFLFLKIIFYSYYSSLCNSLFYYLYVLYSPLSIYYYSFVEKSIYLNYYIWYFVSLFFDSFASFFYCCSSLKYFLNLNY